MKICILNIATNKYIRFVEQLLESVEENFLNEHDISALVFTNHEIEEVAAGTPDQEAAAISFSYTMGSLGIVGTVHDVDNIDNSTTNSREAYSLGLSFNF